MHSYEDKSEDVEDLLRRNRGKWQLDSLAWMDYDDVCQIIRKHLFEKWHLWDQSLDFAPWANTVIRHQIINLLRNNYTNFSRPCLQCEHNLGGTSCSLTKSGEQNSSCSLYSWWEKKRKPAHDVKMPLPIDEQTSLPSHIAFKDYFDYEASSESLHKGVKAKLTNERQREVYHLLYVEHWSEKQVAEKLGFKADSSKSNKNLRFKQIKNLKKKFKTLAKEVLEEEDILQ